MKHLLSITLFLLSLNLYSQSPKAFNYQAIIRDSSGQVLADAPISLKLSLLEGNAEGQAVYSEIHNRTTNTFGLINILVGMGITVTGDFDSIHWSKANYFIKNEIDLFDGTGFRLLGTSQLVSVPYAMHAETVTNLNDNDQDPQNEIQNLSGVLAAGNDAEYQRIVNLAEPISESDAVNKKYVDALLERIENLELLYKGETVDDRDAQSYGVTQIGDLIWMSENLNYSAPEGSWYYNNDSINNSKYGRLYSWETAREACPTGWHLSTSSDWTQLIEFLGGTNVAGGKLKQTGTDQWAPPNSGATDEFGFEALPGGYRTSSQGFSSIDSIAVFAVADSLGQKEFSWYQVYYDSENIDLLQDTSSSIGFSVRCVKGSSANTIPPAEDLILHLPFNGNANDLSGNNNPGIVNGATLVESMDGSPESAYSFDGSDDYISIGTLPLMVDNFNSFSIHFWFKADQPSMNDWGSIFRSMNNDPFGMIFGIDFHRDGSSYEFGRISFDTRDSASNVFAFAVSAPDVFNDEWHHIVFNFISMQSGQADVFIDGSRRTFSFTRRENPQFFTYFENPFVIGAGNNRGTIDWHSKIIVDDFRIYKRALDPGEINALYNNHPD